jgi:hypothetical protein
MTGQTLHSLGELGDAMKGKEKRTVHRNPTETSEPVYVKKLVAILGDNASEAARRLAMSPGHISDGIRQNSIRTVTELAAKGVVMEMEHSKARPLFYFVEVHNGQKDVLDAFLRGMNLKATVL